MKIDKKIYRLDRITFKITVEDRKRALKIIGYYYRNAWEVLQSIGRVRTPYAFYSLNRNSLEDLKSNK